MLNVVAIMGRLARDPEMRQTTTGKNVASFRIACDRNFAKPGEQRQADFVDIVAWRQQADFVSRYFQKGSMIAIDGRLQTRNYQDKNGNSRTAVEVVANNISFAGSKRQDAQRAPSYEQQTTSHVQQAKAAQNASQPAYTQGSMDDFAVINDNDDLPF